MSDSLDRLVEAVYSQAALVVVAVADLGVRFGDEALWLAALMAARALSPLADLGARFGDEALALASLGAGRVLPAVTAWGVFVVGYLRFSPRLYPTLGDPSERPSFRALVAAFTLAYALVFAETSFGASPRLATTLAVGLGVLAAGGLAFAAYFQWVVGWDLLDPDDEVFEPLSRFFRGDVLRNDVESELSRSGRRGSLGAGVWVVTFGAFFVFPAALVGALTAVLLLLVPLPDLLVLAYVVVGPLGSRLPDPVLNVVAVVREGERRFYRPAAHASLYEGVMLGMLVTAGAFGAAGVVWIALGITGGVASLVALAVPTRPLVAWSWTGRLAVLYVAGGYGLWFWLRVVRRLPAHLDRRRGEDSVPPVVRPRWLTLPPMAAVLVVVASLVAPPPLPAAFVAWPLLVAALGWFVVEARRRDGSLAASGGPTVGPVDARDTSESRAATSPSSGHLAESDAIALGVAVELVGVWTAGVPARGGIGVERLVALLVLVVLAWGLARAGRLFAETDGMRGYAPSALLVVAGGVLVVLAPLTVTTPALLAIGGGLAVAGTATTAVRYVER